MVAPCRGLRRLVMIAALLPRVFAVRGLPRIGGRVRRRTTRDIDMVSRRVARLPGLGMKTALRETAHQVVNAGTQVARQTRVGTADRHMKLAAAVDQFDIDFP